MINAQEFQHRGMHVVRSRGMVAVQRLIAPLVALAAGDAPPDAAAAEPVGEYKRIVVAALAPLRAWHPAKLRCPEHECLFEHPSLLKVFEE